MTHLSWDELDARVLERRSSLDQGGAAGIWALVGKVFIRKLLGRIECSGFVVSLWPR
ncbi:hypothetical protein ACVIIW_001700 [Bradyrhizobium sp. USDA 4449]